MHFIEYHEANFGLTYVLEQITEIYTKYRIDKGKIIRTVCQTDL